MKNLTEKQKRILHIILTIVIMVFIFVQSAMPDYASAEESNFFVEIAENIIESVSSNEINIEALSTIIRKLAHFTEYMVFGACLLLTVRDYFRAGLISQTSAHKSATSTQLTTSAQTPTSTQTPASVPTTNSAQQPVTPAHPKNITFTVGAFSWLLGTIYAITDEIHQYFVPGRACSTFDILIDSAGVACGMILVEISLYIMTEKSK